MDLDGLRHDHHRRQDTCGDCTTIVTTTWVPYIAPASTSTVTVHTTQMVFIDQGSTTTVTHTATDGATATPGAKAKRVEPDDLAKRQTVPGNGGLYAITYTPYDSSGGCKSASQVLSDLQDISSKGFPRIRMYGVDCNQLSTVADQAIGLGFHLTLGVYVDNTGTVRGYNDLDAILAWGKWDSVDIINIGYISLSRQI